MPTTKKGQRTHWGREHYLSLAEAKEAAKERNKTSKAFRYSAKKRPREGYKNTWGIRGIEP